MKNTWFKFRYNNKDFDFEIPRIMAIINLTPDSFFDGGKFCSIDGILREAEIFIKDGAYILDLGAASSRPGAILVDEEEEWSRLEPVLLAVRKRFPEIRISVDTFHSKVAERSLEAGADMINDISGMRIDPKLSDVLRKYRCPYVLTHSRGTPQTMAELTQYHDITTEVFHYLEQQLKTLDALGVNHILLDPGFGFAKDISGNFRLLKNLSLFTKLNRPVLAGISRKSMIYKTLNTTPAGALNGTTALHAWALQNGARVLRVHDVKEAAEVLRLWEEYEKN